MNLQEQTNRIKQMMGVIKESSDEERNVIRKMIDTIGIQNTIKFVGDYNLLKPYLKDIDKVRFIKEKVKKINEMPTNVELRSMYDIEKKENQSYWQWLYSFFVRNQEEN
jgi:hypothetical protein